MKRMMTMVATLALGAALGFSLAWVLPWGATGSGDARGGDAGGAGEGSGDDKEILYWVAPMDPDYRRDEPGKSPMGMDLVPVYAGEEPGAGGAATSSVQIDPRVVQNLGIKTADAHAGRLRPTIATLGRLTVDETAVADIHLRSSGWVERLVVRATGEPVARGDLLAKVYAPGLVNAQAEFIQALSSGRATVIEAARDRLASLDIPDYQIARVEETGKPQTLIDVIAPIDGVVTRLGVADGDYVRPETEIMALADLSTLWLIADVFEAQAPLLATGAAVTARATFDPDRRMSGRVDYIYPELDPVTRTVRVRVEVDNADGQLKPGMYASVTIDGRRRAPAVLIPRLALIRTGKADRVILALGDGRFRPAEVQAGIGDGEMVEILAGLKPGERVVTGGQFLIDSESSFAGAEVRLASAEGADPAASMTDMPDMTHDAMDHGAMTHDAGDRANGSAAPPQTAARVVEVRPGARTVRLDHGPIEAFAMPGMVMDFAVAEGVDMAALTADARVHVILARQRNADGLYVIEAVHPMAAEAGQ
ncbi:Cu(I)/Ag(I) efflux system membrane fusion protein [Rhodothalassium salexigens DSM 2132]|uniref:Cu(I)/Ag(I) efflux system membrane fusion protein n=1 Tax=Rhodothalassium salexigens DSM 2132 TaxID=1188247 RepID=A0A4R2PGH2_RHOSA|nr:efflux RND transporter periplasmic adaptor subunit [Rhodothalassium salexigens]MBB4212161.1 Cu(I)/Ag(I) efflux system membrane fusion protein [Rhodothalassium salexigens DSM 2132]MBK1638172.1 hypothetical protein [Rhodothalassium salexigens DSM 2132]TCP33035.1 Cu(I)/Ag(I) efflux system membrane fusion protein [Rhodothalassium salexigens DSM 2132]